MTGVFEHYGMEVGEVKKIGNTSISTFEYKKKDNAIYHMRTIMDGIRPPDDGKYVRLHVNGQLMMSDTEMEKSSNREFVNAANGEVLVAGLGIGLIIYNALLNPSVNHITIIEKYQEVIDLVLPHFENTRITVIHADIFEWQPPKNKKFDTIYFDIWPDINVDNLEEIKQLHNKWKFKLNRSNHDCWMNSWMKERLQSEKRRSSRYW